MTSNILSLADLNFIFSVRADIHRAILESSKGEMISRLTEILRSSLDCDETALVLVWDGLVQDFGHASKDPNKAIQLAVPGSSFNLSKERQTTYIRNKPGPRYLSPGEAANLLLWPLKTGKEPFGWIEWVNKPQGFRLRELKIINNIVPSLAVIGTLLLDIRKEEHRRLEITQALQNAENQQGFLTADSQDGILVLTISGTILDINHAGVKLLEKERKSPEAGHNFVDYLISPENYNVLIQQLRGGILVHDFEMIFGTDEEPKFITASATPLVGLGRSLSKFQLVLRDITERVKFSNELMHTNLELMDVNKQLKSTQNQLIQQEKLAGLGHLAAGIAHEINNPLGFLESNLRSLKKEFFKISDFFQLVSQESNLISPHIWNSIDTNKSMNEIEEIFMESEEGFARIQKIIKSLKFLSHRNGDDMASQAFDLNAVVESSINVAGSELKYVANVETDLKPLKPLYGDSGDLSQVLVNLLVNAFQAIKEENRKDQGTIKIRSFILNQKIILEVEDDGPGISSEVADKIFEPFFTTKGVGEGTGLGLSLSRDIVIRYGGELICINKARPEKGAIFRIVLPVQANPVSEIKPVPNTP